MKKISLTGAYIETISGILFVLVVFAATLFVFSEIFIKTTGVQTESTISQIVFAQIQIIKARCTYIEEENAIILHYDENWDECTEEDTYSLIITASPKELEAGVIWDIVVQVQKTENAELMYMENALQYVPSATIGGS